MTKIELDGKVKELRELILIDSLQDEKKQGNLLFLLQNFN